MSVEVRPARVNTMAPEGKDHLLRVVRRERQAFYDLIDSTNDETWKTPTACTEWEVRDVVGHLVDVTEGYIERFTLAEPSSHSRRRWACRAWPSCWIRAPSDSGALRGPVDCPAQGIFGQAVRDLRCPEP